MHGINKLVKATKVYCTRKLLPKLSEAIKLKTALKYKDFVRAKVIWSKYSVEKKELSVKKVEVSDKTEELREKTRFKIQMYLQAKQW